MYVKGHISTMLELTPLLRPASLTGLLKTLIRSVVIIYTAKADLLKTPWGDVETKDMKTVSRLLHEASLLFPFCIELNEMITDLGQAIVRNTSDERREALLKICADACDGKWDKLDVEASGQQIALCKGLSCQVDLVQHVEKLTHRVLEKIERDLPLKSSLDPLADALTKSFVFVASHASSLDLYSKVRDLHSFTSSPPPHGFSIGEVKTIHTKLKLLRSFKAGKYVGLHGPEIQEGVVKTACDIVVRCGVTTEKTASDAVTVLVEQIVRPAEGSFIAKAILWDSGLSDIENKDMQKVLEVASSVFKDVDPTSLASLEDVAKRLSEATL